jgi:hypothetical protein
MFYAILQKGESVRYLLVIMTCRVSHTSDFRMEIRVATLFFLVLLTTLCGFPDE